MMKEIPISAAKHIADTYGYDQVVIYARKVFVNTNEESGEHMTTYGVNKIHCAVAAKMGETLQKFMGWK
jgi:acetylornithine/succinyldiaminopimelate/putrescine aminotransferase